LNYLVTKTSLSVVLGVAIVAAIAVIAVLTTRNSQDETGLTSLQRAIRVLERMPVIDGLVNYLKLPLICFGMCKMNLFCYFIIFRHNDFPWNLRQLKFNDLREVNFSADLSTIEPWASHPESFTDIPRLRQGRVGGQVNSEYINFEAKHLIPCLQPLSCILERINL
jgi:hypothetical protein